MAKKKPNRKEIVKKCDKTIIKIGIFLAIIYLRDFGIPDDIIKKIVRKT